MAADDSNPGPHDPGFATGISVKAVFCKRLGKQLAVAEHVNCPYCLSGTAEHERSCEYDPAKDPVHFGFPGNTLRDRQG